MCAYTLRGPIMARIACAGGNFADPRLRPWAVKMRGRAYDGDAYQEIRNAGFLGILEALDARSLVPEGELVYPETMQSAGL